MKKIILLLTLLTAVFVPAFAQNRGKDRESMRREVQEYKLKFLAQEMDLKEDQQKRFFDLYKQMTAEKVRVFKETKALEKRLNNSEDASDAEYETVSRAITEAKEKDAEIDRKYDKLFSQFLTSKQIFKMKAAEEKFRDKMHEMRHKKRHLKK